MKKFFAGALFALLLVLAPAGPGHTPTAQEQAEEEPEELETFVPSEKLPADSAISFPVDI